MGQQICQFGVVHSRCDTCPDTTIACDAYTEHRRREMMKAGKHRTPETITTDTETGADR